MSLRAISSSFPHIAGDALFLDPYYSFKNRFASNILFIWGKHVQYNRSKKRYLPRCPTVSLSCSNSMDKGAQVFSVAELTEAKVIYCASPAMGHNQESHPESHFRVPAIISALQKLELTSEFRGSEVLELQNVKPASVDAIASVHASAYVTGLEKAMVKASEQGIIIIEGTGPTYATATTFQESLLAAGAGITLVDSVVISQPAM